MTQRPVCIIGLDGADWRLLEPWLAAGKLPTLARLRAGGVAAPLRSTTRPESSVAWSSFATGVNPGKHGVFGFMVQTTAGGTSYQIANGATIRAERFWDMLSDAGRRVALLNVPFTYPPRPLNGVLLSGMMTPGRHVEFAYPPALQKEVLAKFPTYEFELDSGEKSAETIHHQVTQLTNQQLETALWIIDQETWDCFTVVFTGPDRLQHFAWDEPDRLLAHYQQLDDAIAQIEIKLADDALLLIISDHGFNGVAGRFYGNQWLAGNGWLRLAERQSAASKLLPLVKKAQSISVLRKLKRALLPNQRGASALQAQAFAQRIDWANTKAYFAPDGGIHLNVLGREPQGIVPSAAFEAVRDELASQLRLIKAPNGGSLFTEVYTKEQLYSGAALDHAPDLVAEPQREEAEHHFVLDVSIEPRPSPFGAAAPYQATHALDGILLAHGSDIATTPLAIAPSVIDIAPTVLAALGVPIPRAMNGKPLLTLFKPGTVATPSYTNDYGEYDSSNTTEDDPAIAERLRQLGYIE